MASTSEKMRQYVQKPPQIKRGSVLWAAVRKSMPAFVPLPLRQRFLKQRAPRFMIDPETKPKLGWDLLVTCCVLYTTCVVPYRVCFKRDATGGFATFEGLLDLFFGIDIVLNFLTGVHLPSGEITYEEKVVARSYLRGWFFVDFFSTIPFDSFSKWFGNGDGTAVGGKAAAALASAKLLRSLKILRLFKLARIRKLSKMFLSLEDAVFTNQSLLSLCKLALSMLFLSHLVACLWFVIGSHRPTPSSLSWVEEYGFGNEDALLQYLVSMYWAIVTMVTIGYGDITARNNLERIFAIAIMAVGVSFFGYVIGTITTLVSNLNVAAALYDEQITIVKEYIISRSIPAHLSKRIRDHFEYYYQNRSVFKEKTVLKRLPSAMRNEMIHHRHAKIVSNVKYFAHCHESLISDIVMAMKPFNVLKDEFVYVQHEIAAHVFFLLKGKVSLTKTVSIAMAKGQAPGGEWRMATIAVGEHFGELEVYDHEHGNGVRICSAIAKSYCELTFLSRQAISKISGSWPEVLRHFKDSARETSKRMRRRVEKKPSGRHGSIKEENEDADSDDDEDDEGEKGRDGAETVNTDADGVEGSMLLYHDEEMEAKMMRSTLLAHKTMRANVKKPGRTSRVSPFVGPEDAEKHNIIKPKPAEPPPPQSQQHLHVQTECFTEHDQNNRQRDEKGDMVESLPVMPDATVSAIAAGMSVVPNDDHGNDITPVSPASTPTAGASSPPQKPVRGRLVLEALLLEKVKPGKPVINDSDTEAFDDFGAVAKSQYENPTDESSSTNDSNASKYQVLGEVVVSTAAEHALQPDKSLRSLVSRESSVLSIVNVEEEGEDDDEDGRTPDQPTAPAPSPTPAMGDSDAAAKTAIQMLGRLQPKPNDGSQRKAVWKKAAATAVAVERKSMDSRRNLNEILAKIRGSSEARPKANLHSEQIMLHATYVLHPQERFILTWQFVVGIAILYSIIVVPYRLGFDTEALNSWLVLENLIDCFFGVDILLNFRTAFFDEERILVFDKRVIFWRYVKGWFLVDFVSTVPIDDLAKMALSSSGSGKSITFFPTKLLRLFRVARLLKLARLIKLSRVAGRLRDLVQLSPSTERLFKLLLVMSLFCHRNACPPHAAMLASESSGMGNWCSDFFPRTLTGGTIISSFSSSSSSSSASSSSSDYDSYSSLCSTRISPQDRYIASIYWAFTTFTTVGYGDIKPSIYSTYELGLVIMLIVINATVYGYIISAVVTLIKNLNPSDREYRLRMTEMKDYLRDSTVSVRLGAHIKTHYQHILTSMSLFPEEKLFNKMSPSLRFDLARLVAGETLFAIPLITVMEDSFKGFVSYALFLMKPLCICRSEKVCRSGGPGTEMFFLVEGQCDLVNSQTNEGCVIGTNAVFEQYSLMAKEGEIYRTVSTVTAISKKCILYSLAIQDFRVLEDVSPAVSTYFLSQLAAVLIEDDLFTLTPTQHANVELALRNGRVFRAVAEQHEKARLSSVGTVALAKLAVPRRKGSEWAPDLLPRVLNRMENDGATDESSLTAAAAVHASTPLPIEAVTLPGSGDAL